MEVNTELLYIIFGALIALFLSITTFLFYHRRKQIKDVENRSIRLSMTLAISNIIFCPVLLISNGFKSNAFPCYVILWNVYLSLVIYLTVIFVHGLRLIILAKLNYAMLDISLRKRKRPSLNNRSPSKEFTIKRYRKRASDDVLFYGLLVVIGFFVVTLIGITVRMNLLLFIYSFIFCLTSFFPIFRFSMNFLQKKRQLVSIFIHLFLYTSILYCSF